MSGTDAASRALRLFVALAIEPSVRADVERTLAPVRAEVPSPLVSWVREPNLHLTLRFLGAQPVRLADELTGALRRIATRSEPMTLRLARLGAFPSWRRPSVIWLGVEANVALAALYQKVDDACASLGLGREARAFHPHVTVGRVRRGAQMPPALGERFAHDLRLPVWTTRVNTVDLMSSELAPGGARYTTVDAAPLGVGDAR